MAKVLRGWVEQHNIPYTQLALSRFGGEWGNYEWVELAKGALMAELSRWQLGATTSVPAVSMTGRKFSLSWGLLSRRKRPSSPRLSDSFKLPRSW